MKELECPHCGKYYSKERYKKHVQDCFDDTGANLQKTDMETWKEIGRCTRRIRKLLLVLSDKLRTVPKTSHNLGEVMDEFGKLRSDLEDRMAEELKSWDEDVFCGEFEDQKGDTMKEVELVPDEPEEQVEVSGEEVDVETEMRDIIGKLLRTYKKRIGSRERGDYLKDELNFFLDKIRHYEEYREPLSKRKPEEVQEKFEGAMEKYKEKLEKELKEELSKEPQEETGEKEESSDELECPFCDQPINSVQALAPHISQIHKKEKEEYGWDKIREYARQGKSLELIGEEKVEENLKETDRAEMSLRQRVLDIIKSNPGETAGYITDELGYETDTKKYARACRWIYDLKEKGEIKAHQRGNKNRYYPQELEEEKKSSKTEWDKERLKELKEKVEEIDETQTEIQRKAGISTNKSSYTSYLVREKFNKLPHTENGREFINKLEEFVEKKEKGIKETEESKEEFDKKDAAEFILSQLMDDNYSIANLARKYHERPNLPVSSTGYKRIYNLMRDMIDSKLIEKAENGYRITRRGKREKSGDTKEDKFDILANLIEQKKENGGEIEPRDLIQSGYMDNIEKKPLKMLKDIVSNSTIKKIISQKLGQEVNLKLRNKGGGWSLLVK